MRSDAVDVVLVAIAVMAIVALLLSAIGEGRRVDALEQRIQALEAEVKAHVLLRDARERGGR